jgi:hypothetical protein
VPMNFMPILESFRVMSKRPSSKTPFREGRQGFTFLGSGALLFIFSFLSESCSRQCDSSGIPLLLSASTRSLPPSWLALVITFVLFAMPWPWMNVVPHSCTFQSLTRLYLRAPHLGIPTRSILRKFGLQELTLKCKKMHDFSSMLFLIDDS